MTSARDFRIAVGERVGHVSACLVNPADAKAVLVLAHGAGAGMRHRFMEGVAGRLAERRIATLRYQFPYTEAGRRRPDPPGVLRATVRSAVSAAEGVLPGVPLFAGGKSMGGRMTSQTASGAGLPSVRGLVFFGFPLHPAGRPSIERAEHLSGVPVPMLFLQGTRDSLSELELLRPVCRSLGSSVHLHVIEGADHSFHMLKRSGRTEDDVLDELTEVTAMWLGGAQSGSGPD